MKNFTSVQNVDDFLKSIGHLNFLGQLREIQILSTSIDSDDKNWLLRSTKYVECNKCIMNQFAYYCNEKILEYGSSRTVGDLFSEILNKMKNGMNVENAEEYLESVLIMNKLIGS